MKHGGCIVSSFIFLSSLLVWGGCKDDGCERLYARNKECAAEFEEFIKKDAQDRMEKSMKMARDEEAIADMKKAMPGELDRVAEVFLSTMAGEAFLIECGKNWHSRENEHLKKKKQLRKCLGKSGCSDYVECVMSVVLIGRDPYEGGSTPSK